MLVYTRHVPKPQCLVFFFFNDTATTEIYTLSLHDALPISVSGLVDLGPTSSPSALHAETGGPGVESRSEEHTSELQSHSDLVCRLLLEKKKTKVCKHVQLRNTHCKTHIF